MIPNVRGSVTDYANEKCVYAGRCLGPINRPCAVAGFKLYSRTCLVETPGRPSKTVPTLQVSPHQRDRNLRNKIPEHTIFIYIHITTCINHKFMPAVIIPIIIPIKMKCDNITFSITAEPLI